MAFKWRGPLSKHRRTHAAKRHTGTPPKKKSQLAAAICASADSAAETADASVATASGVGTGAASAGRTVERRKLSVTGCWCCEHCMRGRDCACPGCEATAITDGGS